jgi:hypothetical protein
MSATVAARDLVPVSHNQLLATSCQIWRLTLV